MQNRFGSFADELVRVRCFTTAGAPVDTLFTVNLSKPTPARSPVLDGSRLLFSMTYLR